MVNSIATLRGRVKERLRPFTTDAARFRQNLTDQCTIQENLERFNLIYPNNFHCKVTYWILIDARAYTELSGFNRLTAHAVDTTRTLRLGTVLPLLSFMGPTQSACYSLTILRTCRSPLLHLHLQS
jgi:hypothetical protein